MHLIRIEINDKKYVLISTIKINNALDLTMGGGGGGRREEGGGRRAMTRAFRGCCIIRYGWEVYGKSWEEVYLHRLA